MESKSYRNQCSSDPLASISIEAFLHESPSLLAWSYMLNRAMDPDPAVLIAFGSRFLKARTYIRVFIWLDPVLV